MLPAWRHQCIAEGCTHIPQSDFTHPCAFPDCNRWCAEPAAIWGVAWWLCYGHAPVHGPPRPMPRPRRQVTDDYPGRYAGYELESDALARAFDRDAAGWERGRW